MNVLLVSQCSKRALIETRRILDQFAERRGDRTWQTAITQDGLSTLRRLLQRTARKNTAVACHWIRRRNQSELLWIVGDASQFNAQGATPTDTTNSDVLRKSDENDWHTAEEIGLLSRVAALFHDLGKANVAFQRKLRTGDPIADALRHEWVSLRLFESFVARAQDDREWLNRLAALPNDADETCLKNLPRDGIDTELDSPFVSLPPLAKVVGWLILTHHRLPMQQSGSDALGTQSLKDLLSCIEPRWNSVTRFERTSALRDTWKFKSGKLPLSSVSWRKQAGAVAKTMLGRQTLFEANWLQNPFVLHLSRLGLMLSDHYYSSGGSRPQYGDPDFPLFANSRPDLGLNQRLDEHLVGVEINAGRVVQQLPYLERALPRLARHKGFTRRTVEPRFRWQDRAFDMAVGMRQRASNHGFFGVNMASTGCGKTLANGRIFYGLADPIRGARFSIALGLRTLTLQTGEVYREQLGLGKNDLAVLVGGGAMRELSDSKRDGRHSHSLIGAESAESLLPHDSYVRFEGDLESGPLKAWLSSRQNSDGWKLLSGTTRYHLLCLVR